MMIAFMFIHFTLFDSFGCKVKKKHAKNALADKKMRGEGESLYFGKGF